MLSDKHDELIKYHVVNIIIEDKSKDFSSRFARKKGYNEKAF